jgi:hypothetical protein
MRKSSFTSVYASLASFSRLTALVGTYLAIVCIFLVARIPWVEKGVGDDCLVTWHRNLGPGSLFGTGAAFATVVGPSGWLCDGLVTALIVVGEGGATYFSQPKLVGYQVFVIGRHENTTWSI